MKDLHTLPLKQIKTKASDLKLMSAEEANNDSYSTGT